MRKIIIAGILYLCFFNTTYTLQGQTKWQSNYYRKMYLYRSVDCSALETIIRLPFNVTRFGFFNVENIYIIENSISVSHFSSCDTIYLEYEFLYQCGDGISCIRKNKVIVVSDIKYVPNPDESRILLFEIERLSKKTIKVVYSLYNRAYIPVIMILKKTKKGYKIVHFPCT